MSVALSALDGNPVAGRAAPALLPSAASAAVPVAAPVRAVVRRAEKRESNLFMSTRRRTEQVTS